MVQWRAILLLLSVCREPNCGSGVLVDNIETSVEGENDNKEYTNLSIAQSNSKFVCDLIYVVVVVVWSGFMSFEQQNYFFGCFEYIWGL